MVGRLGPRAIATVSPIASASACASGGLVARTAVTWPCMTVVDRSQSAVLQFPHELLSEDTDLAPEEMSGNRRQQFVVQIPW